MASGEGEAPRAFLIAGPTASGKSALALMLADRLGGTVINADSMQVYDTLRILTARPSPQDEAAVPHRLYGHVPLTRAYSVGAWLADVRAALAEAAAAGRPAIIVGGTGLYFKALTGGLPPMPDIPEAVRGEVRRRLELEGSAALHAELAVLDPQSARRINVSDPQRIVRALEVAVATGRPLSEWQREPALPLLPPAPSVLRLVLWPDREAVRARIDARVGAMLAAGALDEVRAAMAMDLDPSLPGYRAHGLRPFMAHLRGELPLQEAAERTRAETRQYAKRQFTWFRHQMPDWERLDPDRAADRLAAVPP
ncbi:tRNA dimethylallyltransferase [Tepidamorphus gemmatus]|uniref:tRNA dimethylallyltransferase n=1 Tax=Tepidamorphus gemmatus TaxID=747076 RepID=A0A4V2UYQ4_9HYPH|nr:tRNA (adenosine(37)-N6)-dimethylallyltransferase MiaA [Tepidamorphus gemmatus]TCT08338.1 tRNA dimethylallyltransferase [Tepidamorphus gemmatus]